MIVCLLWMTDMSAFENKLEEKEVKSLLHIIMSVEITYACFVSMHLH